MLFSTNLFVLVFMPLAVGAFYAAALLAPRHASMRLGVMVAASVAFYSYWDVRFLPLLLGSVLANWLFARAALRWRLPHAVPAGIVFNLVLLGIFKYADFFGESLYWLAAEPYDAFDIILPIGISFFTFQQISYLADISRGEHKVYPLLDYAAYVTFFPQLIAGPIVRHDELLPQLRGHPVSPETFRNLTLGAVLFTIGLAKKVLLADPLGGVVDPVFAAAGGALGWTDAWGAALAYTLQIYFDFSGYSDMALGLGLLFGLRLPVNFDAPYRSASIQEFWRRWHMTLSRFLRDYLYIPLGGNRGSEAVVARNLMVTMALAGLWHGAGWTFVVWGVAHGVALAFHRFWRRSGAALPWAAGWALTFLFVVLTFVIFRAETLGHAFAIFAAMLAPAGGPAIGVDWTLVAAGLAIALFGPTSQAFVFSLDRPRPVLAAAFGAVFAVMAVRMAGAYPDAFIYFQF